MEPAFFVARRWESLKRAGTVTIASFIGFQDMVRPSANDPSTVAFDSDDKALNQTTLNHDQLADD